MGRKRERKEPAGNDRGQRVVNICEHTTRTGMGSKSEKAWGAEREQGGKMHMQGRKGIRMLEKMRVLRPVHKTLITSC